MPGRALPQAVTVLASERASYVAGATIRIDGGLIRGV